MPTLTGLPTLGSPLAGEPLRLEHLRDICRSDRPMIALYQSAGTSSKYLEIWADCDEDIERWLIFRVLDRDLAQYLHGALTLRALVVSTPDRFVFVKDVASNDETNWFVSVEDLPVSLLPSEGSHYDISLDPCPSAGEEQAILLDGTWTADSLAGVQRGYTQVLAVATCLGHKPPSEIGLLKEKFDSYKFNGGFVRRNALQRLVEVLPKAPKTLEIQYASPGILRIGVEASSGEAARRAYEAFKENFRMITVQYEDVHEQLLAARRGDEKAGGKAKKASKKVQFDKVKLARAVDALISAFKTLNKSSVRLVARADLAAGELLSSYYRRLRHMMQLEADGAAKFL